MIQLFLFNCFTLNFVKTYCVEKFPWFNKLSSNFFAMDKKTNNELSGIDVTCSICLDMLHRPQEIDPCKHMFCQSCLIRLCHEGTPMDPHEDVVRNCPLCRGPINDTKFNRELNKTIRSQHPEEYLSRENLEAESGIFLIFGSRTPYHRDHRPYRLQY